ncbi:N-acetyl sugar amidotransferase [Candidatus Marinimicrobia bacterium MT.SAG.3]|nr:N-acetyl sugar amidotransferase [Candidatus Marinimicrobia bacterium MT.SAG.3]
MDSEVGGIEFNENGICNYCEEFDILINANPAGEKGQLLIDKVVGEMKTIGKNKSYDCVVGVSGGTDSTYLLYILKNLGLRPLAVHFDNGWNTEIAVSNIKNAVTILDIDLFTYVVNWEEFKDLQLSFLKASLPEVEIPTDMGIRAILYKIAVKEGVKHVISGNSFRAEGIVPQGWGYKDGKLLEGVQKIFGTQKLKTFPNLLLFKYLYYVYLRKIKIVRILNFMDYSKEEAKKLIIKELDWQDYGGHHFESIYTRFFQGYLAPVKFNMDRRKVTMSALVRLGKLDRDEALKLLTEEIYSPEMKKEDMQYISKKLGIGFDEFVGIIGAETKSFHEYPSYYPLMKKLTPILNWMNKKKILSGFFQTGKFSR